VSQVEEELVLVSGKENKKASSNQKVSGSSRSSSGGGKKMSGFGSGGSGGAMQPGEIVNPVTAVLLAMFTCGIYPLIWIFKRLNEINTFLGREEIPPMMFWGGFICGPVFLFVIWKMIQALPEMGQKAGVEIEDRSAVLIVLMLCFAPGFYYMYQTDLNTIWEAAGATPN
jgi:hypothetical protein